MKKIIERTKLTDFAPEGMDPVIARIYSGRGVRDRDELELGLDRLLDFHALRDIDKASLIIADAVKSDRRILVFGDYDVDGATSTALTVECLRNFGASHVTFMVPDRQKNGYGLNAAVIDDLKEKENPGLIITVDNGVSSAEGISEAKRLGISVVITDHHLFSGELPEADAVVNPNCDGDSFPSKNLAGVGVAFYVMTAVRALLRDEGWFEKKGIEMPRMARELDLVALGTITDVVPFDHNNRILVSQGLRRIRAGLCHRGVIELCEVSHTRLASITEQDLGFRLGPRLNAAGRLDSMRPGVEILLENDPAKARQLAYRLSSINLSRKTIEAQARTEAMRMLDGMADSVSGHSVVLYSESWHEGVIGLIAARVKDRLFRPAVVFTKTGSGELKGSARSIPAFHIKHALDLINERCPGLIIRYGGHSQAAGLSIVPSNLDAFRSALESAAGELLSGSDFTEMLPSDGQLDRDHLSLEFADTLAGLGPWGQQFEEPRFDGVFTVMKSFCFGATRSNIKFFLRSDEGGEYSAVYFRAPDDVLHVRLEGMRVRVYYEIAADEYNGSRTLVLIIHWLAPADGEQD